jgi:hypothetical protein
MEFPMPNATVRANARTTPKPPPGSAEPIRRQTDELNADVAMLKALEQQGAKPPRSEPRGSSAVLAEAARHIEREQAQPGSDRDYASEYSDLEDAVRQVRTWASIAVEINDGLRLPIGMSREDRVGIEQLDVIIYKFAEAADDLYAQYHRRSAHDAGSGGEPDPVFGLIKAHRTAWDEFVKQDLAEPRDEAVRQVARDEAFRVMDELMETPPVTMAGAKAVLEYFVEWDRDCMPDDSGQYFATLAASPIFAASAGA